MSLQRSFSINEHVKSYTSAMINMVGLGFTSLNSCIAVTIRDLQARYMNFQGALMIITHAAISHH